MTTRELSGSPSMLGLFARAGARAGVGAIPLVSRLPFIPGRATGDGSIPSLTFALNDVAADHDRLAAYDRVCGFSLKDTLPPTYPHMLAFPLHLKLMTDSSFPFAAIGLVHIENTITQHRAIGVDERLSLKVWATEIEPHPRGRQFAIRTEATVDEEVVWEEVSTNLKRGGGGGAGDKQAKSAKSAKSELDDVDLAALPATATWRLPGDLGRRYGSVSGDLNPIHIHPLTARLFGFPSAIAHGMWTKARSLAALEPRLPDAFTVEVAFKKPILLPATVEFASDEVAPAAAGEQSAPVQFGVRDANKGTPHLVGAVT
jgi:acyl dehydratase